MDENRGTTPGGNDASLRVPPHDLHAEQAVLASVLLNNDLINGVMEVLRPGDFYQGAHRILYEAMVDLYDRGRPIDQLTLSSVLKDRNAEQQVGGLAYLSEIVTSVPISDNVVHYARIVKEKSILRKTIAAAQEITTAAFQGVADIDVFLDQTEQAIFAIAEEKIKPSYYVMGEMAREAMKEIEEAYERKERITGVASGFRDLDQVTAGFQRSNMIVVAARPGMGKTSLCLNIAVNAATKQKLPVAIFSLEMSRQELAMRMICSEARVNFQRLRTGHLAQEEVNRLVAAVGKLSEAPIYTDDSGTLSAMELRAKARRLKKERGIGMIIVDYLQLMHGSNTRQNSENRVQEVSEISRSMKSLAKELNIPVVAVSQLSRGVESRNDKRPQMADLRECVTGDTLVLTTDGGRVPIRELVGKQVDVWAMSPEGRIVPAKSECVWSVGEKPVMRVVLASGRTIRATPEHLLYGPGVWTRVGELKPGDRLAVARAVPEPEQPVVWPEEHIALLGHLVGDGSYLVNQPMRYTTASEENSRAVSEAAQGAFGCTVKRYAGRGKWHQLLITGNGNRWHPAGVNRWLRDLGIFGSDPTTSGCLKMCSVSTTRKSGFSCATCGRRTGAFRAEAPVRRDPPVSTSAPRARDWPATWRRFCSARHRRPDSHRAEDRLPAGVYGGCIRCGAAGPLPGCGRSVRPTRCAGAASSGRTGNGYAEYEHRYASRGSVRPGEGGDAGAGDFSTYDGGDARDFLWRELPLRVRSVPGGRGGICGDNGG